MKNKFLCKQDKFYSKQIVSQKLEQILNSIYAKKDFSFKALASQVLAMAAQDNMNPIGQKFNFLA